MSMLCFHPGPGFFLEIDEVGRKRFQSAYDRTYVDPGIDASATDADPGAIQSFKEESDINNIMKDVQTTGATNWLATRPGTFEDVTGVDFQTCMDTTLRAQEAFDDLPSSVRDRFQNNPVAFLDFVHDPANADELVRMGLREPAAAPAAVSPSPLSPVTGSTAS